MAAAIGAAPRGFQDVRALPIAAGGAVFFTHRVIHWGSASRAGYPTPRIACSWAATGKKSILFVRFVYRKIMLPRQARDKHRENSKKSTVLLQRMITRSRISRESICPCRRPPCARACARGSSSTTTSAFVRASTGSTSTTGQKERLLRAILMLKTEHLPRQARDKRNENSGKGYVFFWQGV